MDLELNESVHSTPYSVRRHRKPPPIRGPPGQFEDSDSEDSNEDPLASPRDDVLELKMKNNQFEERLAEIELWRMEMDDKQEILRKPLCAKFKRLLKELGRPDLYDSTLP